MSKFKVGDTIYFMESNKPVAKEVKGILKIQGEVDLKFDSVKVEDNQEKVFYITGYISRVDEIDCFKSMLSLKRGLFKSINN